MENNVLVRVFICLALYAVGMLSTFGMMRESGKIDGCYADMWACGAGVALCGILLVVLCFTGVI